MAVSSKLLICTVGTSLLTNTDDRPWSGWTPANRMPLPDAETVDRWMHTADPVKISAETHTLHALEISESDSLYLLHSDTPEGQYCADRLRNLYQPPRCRHVEMTGIGRLGYGADQFAAGLKSLVAVACCLIREGREKGQEILLCATGGFKAEIAYLNLLGALLDIEVVYIHERHRSLVRLPRLPLAWDTEVVNRHADFFAWIDSEPRRSVEVESWLKAAPELRTLIEDDEEGYTYLSPAGDLLYQAAKERLAAGEPPTWPDPDDSRLPSEKNHLSGVCHERPKGWERVVERLCAIAFVQAVRYDPTRYGGGRVHIVDASTGTFGFRYTSGDKTLPLRVETTARGQAQCELVAGYLRRIK